MVIKLVFRPHALSSSILSSNRFFSKPSHPKFYIISLFSTNSHSQALALSQSLTYGPSLHKGKNRSQQSHFQSSPIAPYPHKQEEDKEEGIGIIDEESFTRVFDIAAIRAPANDCFPLENRLRGHLLNWPRIRNIARVPGDEVDEEFLNLLGEKKSNSDEEDEDNLITFNRRMHGKSEGDGELLSPVLYREKLVNEFDSRGFIKFRNLAKMSRPNKKNKRKEEEVYKGRKGIGKNEFSVVEVLEDNVEGEDLSGLLGSDFKGRKWRGSTRLLLLDERYASNSVDELPDAIKAVIKEDAEKNVKPTLELVRCRLTLFYSYWQMSEILEALLPDGNTIPSAFETVGHIAHLNLKDEHLPYKKIIAQVVLDKNRPKIQTVVNKCDAIHNDYRTMQLEVLAGNRSLVATVAENGLHFQVDLATVYWNSRLATERQRVLSYFTSNDVVCDVFSGVGPIAISAAKKVKHVYANDLNPHAVEYLKRNSALNNLDRKIEISNMDGRRFINAIFSSHRAQSITHVVMNLPKDAAEYLDSFRGVFRDQPKGKLFTMPRIHVYGFSKAQDPEFDFHERIRIALAEVAFEVEMRKVRVVAPGKWMLCASFILPESVAFAKTNIKYVK